MLGNMNPMNALASPYATMQDFRAARPDQATFGQGGGFRNALMDWRALMPQGLGGGGQHGGGMGNGAGGGPVMQPPIVQAPQLTNGTYGFTAPQGMIGANYNIPGAQMPVNPYRLPTYTPGG